MIKIGLAGKPNGGKSTFFKSSTLANVEIASYPFTTIDANHGIAFARSVCPCVEMDEKCGNCKNGFRFVPVEMIDVAGLVPDAHLGKGLGNEFLDNLRQADVIIDVVDASGSTDEGGNTVEIGSYDPLKEVDFIERELSMWFYGIIKRDWGRTSRKIQSDGMKVLAEKLAGLGVSEQAIKRSIDDTELPEKTSSWKEDDLRLFSETVIKRSKPIIIAANKMDIAPEENLSRLERLDEKGYKVILTSAAGELALRMAEKNDFIRYIPGDEDFEIVDDKRINKKQLDALEYIKNMMKEKGGTGVQNVINTAVFDLLKMIVVYPVENEKKCTDKDGNVLPDAFLLKKGSKAKDLAYQVHSDIGDGFLFAIDARKKMRLGEDYELKENEIIKIVSSR
ncbi:MAG: translation-associated GTPase [Candidatus Methanolliviera sp. GoM_oil]|nr:MAG: translation-associated GTPase [Candidatus Methanolliviera sp. GoM_oil]